MSHVSYAWVMSHMNESRHMPFMCKTWLIHVRDMTYSRSWHDCAEARCLQLHSVHRWLRLVGSIKLQVSFAEYWLFCRALLQKRPIIFSILLTKATPYRCGCVCIATYHVGACVSLRTTYHDSRADFFSSLQLLKKVSFFFARRVPWP